MKHSNDTPQPPPIQWLVFYSEKAGREYYYEPKSKIVTWILPDEDHSTGAPNHTKQETIVPVVKRGVSFHESLDEVPTWKNVKAEKQVYQKRTMLSVVLAFFVLTIVGYCGYHFPLGPNDIPTHLFSKISVIFNEWLIGAKESYTFLVGQPPMKHIIDPPLAGIATVALDKQRSVDENMDQTVAEALESTSQDKSMEHTIAERDTKEGAEGSTKGSTEGSAKDQRKDQDAVEPTTQDEVETLADEPSLHNENVELPIENDTKGTNVTVALPEGSGDEPTASAPTASVEIIETLIAEEEERFTDDFSEVQKDNDVNLVDMEPITADVTVDVPLDIEGKNCDEQGRADVRVELATAMERKVSTENTAGEIVELPVLKEEESSLEELMTAYESVALEDEATTDDQRLHDATLVLSTTQEIDATADDQRSLDTTVDQSTGPDVYKTSDAEQTLIENAELPPTKDTTRNQALGSEFTLTSREIILTESELPTLDDIEQIKRQIDGVFVERRNDDPLAASINVQDFVEETTNKKTLDSTGSHKSRRKLQRPRDEECRNPLLRLFSKRCRKVEANRQRCRIPLARVFSKECRQRARKVKF